jgi:dTDP-4-amino-4,6-dideoxygalactose transaminase
MGTDHRIIRFNDLKKQVDDIQDEINQSLKEVFDRGQFILGSQVEAFEKEFADYCGADYAVGVGSGTEALHLALIAAGIQSGDRVITVPNTAVPTVSAITFAQATPVFVDIDPETYTMDVNRLEDVLKKYPGGKNRPKAVIPVHLYGQCAEMDPILYLARRYGLKIIEDACQAHGSLYKNRKSGTMGDAGCFSFYPTKNLGAYGDGGAVITNNKKLAGRLRMLRNYGEVKKYEHRIKGFNSRLDELQAAVLRRKLIHLDTWNETRRRVAKQYHSLLRDADVILPREAKDHRHIYHLYVVRHRQRNALRAHLLRNGVETAIHYPIPVHLQKAYIELGRKKGSYPVAEKMAKEIVSLPMYPGIDDPQVERICSVIRQLDRRATH